MAYVCDTCCPYRTVPWSCVEPSWGHKTTPAFWFGWGRFQGSRGFKSKQRASVSYSGPKLFHARNSQQDLRLTLQSPFSYISFLSTCLDQLGPQPARNSLTDHPFTVSQILGDPNSCKPSLSPLPFQTTHTVETTSQFSGGETPRGGRNVHKEFLCLVL